MTERRVFEFCSEFQVSDDAPFWRNFQLEQAGIWLFVQLWSIAQSMTVSRLRARPKNLFLFPAQWRYFLPSKESTSVIGQPPSLLFSAYWDSFFFAIMHPGREADHSFPSNVEVKNVWSSVSTSPRRHNVYKDNSIRMCVCVCVCVCMCVCTDILLQLYYHSSLDISLFCVFWYIST